MKKIFLLLLLIVCSLCLASCAMEYAWSGEFSPSSDAYYQRATANNQVIEVLQTDDEGISNVLFLLND